jgi:transcriptional regulator with XRE-family HTH domain
MTDVQRQLRRIRRSHDLRQEDVARQAGISRRVLGSLESEERTAIRDLCRAAAAVGHKVVLVPLDPVSP